MTLKFRQEKVTKNTIKFEEILESSLDVPRIGTLYIQKAALKELGWQDGAVVAVDIKVGDPE